MNKESLAPKTLGLTLLVLASLFVLSCAHKPEISRPATVGSGERPQAGWARVYFVRPPQARGGNQAISIWEQDRIIGYLRAGQVAYVDVAPGEHRFMGVLKTADMVEATLAPDRVYFVHCRYVSFYMGAALYMDPLTPASENWPMRWQWVREATPMELITENVAWWNETYRAENAERLARLGARPPAERKLLIPGDGD